MVEQLYTVLQGQKKTGDRFFSFYLRCAKMWCSYGKLFYITETKHIIVRNINARFTTF